MAAILTADAALAAALAEACEVAVGDAADFLNACAEIGILETGAAEGAAAWRNVAGSLKRGKAE
jgi:hypothetical protein